MRAGSWSIDAPPSYAANLPKAIAELTDKPVTHVVYSHSHSDHIGGASLLGGRPIIVAHSETLRLVKRASDPRRPLPTVTFSDRYSLRVGSKVLELSYHGNAHEPGNIFIHAPSQRVLMVVDVVFPGWMPWRRFALAQDIPGYFAQVEQLRTMDWDVLVGGHVARTGTHADVDLQAEFNRDIKQAAATALASTKFGVGLNPKDESNPWAGFGNYIDRVAAQCVNTLTPKWSRRLAGFRRLHMGPVLRDGAESSDRVVPSNNERLCRLSSLTRGGSPCRHPFASEGPTSRRSPGS